MLSTTDTETTVDSSLFEPADPLFVIGTEIDELRRAFSCVDVPGFMLLVKLLLKTPVVDPCIAYFTQSAPFILALINRRHAKWQWADYAAMGCGYLPLETAEFHSQIETMARNAYIANKNPIECSLLYLCLKKKSVLLGLWKICPFHPEQTMMQKFLQNDFDADTPEGEKWRKAALKNAFALLGKGRYEYACCFFILGNKVWDAIGVICKNLGDLQLALLLAR